MLAFGMRLLLKTHTRKTSHQQWGSNLQSLECVSKLFTDWAILAPTYKWLRLTNDPVPPQYYPIPPWQWQVKISHHHDCCGFRGQDPTTSTPYIVRLREEELAKTSSMVADLERAVLSQEQQNKIRRTIKDPQKRQSALKEASNGAKSEVNSSEMLGKQLLKRNDYRYQLVLRGAMSSVARHRYQLALRGAMLTVVRLDSVIWTIRKSENFSFLCFLNYNFKLC